MDLPKCPLPRRHRSRAFWLGLAGLMMLTGVWLGSADRQRGLSFMTADPARDRALAITAGNGILDLRFCIFPAGSLGGPEVKTHSSRKVGMKWWPEKWIAWDDGAPSLVRIWSLHLPIWFFIPAWSAGWALWMVWRNRREAYFARLHASSVET